MLPESETEFFLRVVDARITFGRNDAGAVDHLVLHQNGTDQRAVRLPEGEFFCRVVDAQITFQVEGDRVAGLTIHQSGRELTARRLPK